MSQADTSFSLTRRQDKQQTPVYKYLDIDSTYRNRNLYQNPNTFVIPMVYAGRNSSAATAVDPIANAVPYTGSTVNAPGANTLQAGSTTTDIVLDPTEPSIANYYVNSILEIPGAQPEFFPTITSYDGTTKIATVSPAFTAPPGAGNVYYTRMAQPIFQGTISTAFVPSTTTSFALDNSASASDGVYNNSYILFTSGANIGVSALVVSYAGTTRKITISTTLPVAPANGDTIELDNYSSDNASTLIFAGNLSGNSQAAYYEIDLLWLSMPKQILDVGNGGYLDAYPYVYVQLYNQGNQLANQVLYSNNPNSVNALFKVPVNEYFGDTSFMTLKDAKTRQIVQFHPDQDLFFAVTLPNGTIVSFQEADRLSPEAPNPLLQVNALFSLRKVG